MRTLLLGFAAACVAITLPAAAQAQWRDSAADDAGSPGMAARAGHHHDGDGFGQRHRHRQRGSGDTVFVTDAGKWAAYNNRGWDSDSYNDWWHDRPDRAFPRWMQHNDDCQRIWWSGGGWRC